MKCWVLMAWKEEEDTTSIHMVFWDVQEAERKADFLTYKGYTCVVLEARLVGK